ncbi:MAG: hypothetical protein JO101_11490 [Candidatus Eremiobacteraeota bacterium]|nr:hypothetical protein [Candidatus Eremiobacteraeota bacterium]MBV8355937.1 hypothetical protein [Candidatus Eremiobacteraeota bacterium]
MIERKSMQQHQRGAIRACVGICAIVICIRERSSVDRYAVHAALFSSFCAGYFMCDLHEKPNSDISEAITPALPGRSAMRGAERVIQTDGSEETQKESSCEEDHASEKGRQEGRTAPQESSQEHRSQDDAPPPRQEGKGLVSTPVLKIASRALLDSLFFLPPEHVSR